MSQDPVYLTINPCFFRENEHIYHDPKNLSIPSHFEKELKHQ